MTVIIAACSSRKRTPPDEGLVAAALPNRKLSRVADVWFQRVRMAHNTTAARRLYVGRGALLAGQAASLLAAPLYFVSAGMGVVSAEAMIPSYDLTISSGSPQDILSRATNRIRVSPGDWWRLVCNKSPVGSDLVGCIRRHGAGLILLALPSGYLEMVGNELTSLEDEQMQQLRIFTSQGATIPERLRPLVMPYDERLDGPDSPIPGTRSDFASRALMHFAKSVARKTPFGLEAHSAAVGRLLAGWRVSRTPVRRRLTDDDLRVLIGMHWDATGGRQARLLRLLRDDLGVACEQGRLARLVRDARARIEGTP